MNVKLKKQSCASFRVLKYSSDIAPLTDSRPAAEVANNKRLPTETSESIDHLLTSNKARIPRNAEQEDHNRHFLNSSRRGQVYIEYIAGRHSKKKRWASKMKDP